jgi:acyl carrier protein
MNNLSPRLAACFSAVFPGLGPDQIASANTESVKTWDSVATATLMAVIEEEFQVEFAPEEITHLLSFKKALALLQDKGIQS